VMIVDKKEGAFSQTLLGALQKQMPLLPAVFQQADKPITQKVTPKTVLMPLDLATEPPAQLRKWLSQFKGLRMAVPYVDENKHTGLTGSWVSTGGAANLAEAAGQVVQIVRQAAEGQEIRQKSSRSGWMVFVYIMAGIFGLELLFALISLSVSLIAR
jgi:hypothetical protein